MEKKAKPCARKYHKLLCLFVCVFLAWTFSIVIKSWYHHISHTSGKCLVSQLKCWIVFSGITAEWHRLPFGHTHLYVIICLLSEIVQWYCIGSQSKTNIKLFLCCLSYCPLVHVLTAVFKLYIALWNCRQ